MLQCAGFVPRNISTYLRHIEQIFSYLFLTPVQLSPLTQQAGEPWHGEPTSLRAAFDNPPK